MSALERGGAGGESSVFGGGGGLVSSSRGVSITKIKYINSLAIEIAR